MTAHTMSELPPIRCGIAGLGTVGAAVVRLLQQEQHWLAERAGRAVVVTAVSARERNRERGVTLDAVAWEDNPQALATRDDVDVVVELMGGADGAAYDLVKAALLAGKSVVTANKALLAHHGVELAALAEQQQVMLTFEAAVAGAIPVVESFRRGLAANPIARMAGILNGTCNYILTTMERSHASFDDVLADAQAKGYAEADPSFDIDGVDTAHKLVLLAMIAFRARLGLQHVAMEGIRAVTPQDIAFAREFGYRIKLLGMARQLDNGISLSVAPALVALHEPMAQVGAAFNAISIEGAYAGRLFLEGLGAGGNATASSVVSDILAVSRGTLHGAPSELPFATAAQQLREIRVIPASEQEGRFYLRLRVLDQPGVLARIAETFAHADVSLKSVLQRSAEPDAPVDVVLMTHRARGESIARARDVLANASFSLQPPFVIRIEE